jgi:hypothetical protein
LITDVYGFEFRGGSNETHFLMNGNLTLCGVAINSEMRFYNGNLFEVDEDPYDGEWRSPEYKNAGDGLSEDFLDYLNDTFLMGENDE